MNPIRILIIALAAATVAHGDIAPTTFTGTNVFPLQNTDVRMANADVRITWGSPCSLEATFSMLNESDHEIDLEVGFPVGAYHADPQGNLVEDEDNPQAKPVLEPVDPKVISIVVNGEAVTAYRRLPHERVKELKWRYASWYFAKINFTPGANTVSVRTRLAASGIYGQPYKRQLSYCISTGGRWKGTIGRETVEIVFPRSTVSALLTGTSPKDGQARGESIRWEFNDFEPQGAEYDIDCEFLLPSVAAKLAETKAAYEQNPDDSKAALRHAIHLFCLGWGKGNSGFPPGELSAENYRAVLKKTEGADARAVFQRFYAPKDGRYVAATSEWTEDRQTIIQILADAGFSDNYPEYARVTEARAILERCLARDPRNADVWAAYLMHFWRFSFAARGHWFGPTVYSKPLRAAIESALKNCPEDPRIRGWSEAMKKDTAPPTVNFSRPDELIEALRNEYIVNE